ncbi:MAG: GntP family permease [Thermoguttaceae bacterium]|nr:GntP family permease [Thermoguttaceae bacterium]
MWTPFVILAFGIAAVLTLIIRFRVNAFVALITAAILVSIVSPGQWSLKITRVAEGFGRTATSIAIVIAFAAIIGKCLMDSGAADRIVRFFQRLLGKQRTSAALLASGYVLSIPVFFDTVFYLLVPLARSLWRQTRRDYVLYVTAIAAGAVITHSIVPPTPGPLVMAETFRIDLGLLILVGAVIGIPMAVLAMFICLLMNKRMDIPMRPYPGEEEPAPLSEDQMPGLILSFAPILLPVILISANTFAQMTARAEAETMRIHGDCLDWHRLCDKLANAEKTPPDAPLRLLYERLPERLREALSAGPRPVPENTVTRLREFISHQVGQSQFATAEFLAEVVPPPEAQQLRSRAERKLPAESAQWSRKERLVRALDQLSPRERALHNWMLLEAAFPDCRRTGPWEQVAEIAAILGNPNFSLFLAAVIAMGTLIRWRGLTLDQLGQVTETALMSAGIIILITAGGGAFGAVLREAGVQNSLEALLGQSGTLGGRWLLVLGFLLASVMKVAQGSGTVSMITSSAMMAAIGASPETLGCHPVYLAVAIGCGSMCGSWMNDSGFWVYARMGGFTEKETLQTWTVLLILIGTFGALVTVLASILFPLI